MNIGFLIKRHRKAIGVTQSDMAAQFGVTRQTIAKWEEEGIPDERESQIYEWLQIEPPQKQEGKIVPALVSLERLYHFRCGHCDAWWSVADRRPRVGSVVSCPDCGGKNSVDAIENE